VNAPPIHHLIACGVFRPALEHLQLERKFSHVQTIFLPSHFHINPFELKTRLRRLIQASHTRNAHPLVLYGRCFPDIEDFCQHQGAAKIPGPDCFEMLLGSERYDQLLDETAGTYFIERELIVNFEELCQKPLELDDEQLRKDYFRHYRRLLYIRQPLDPDLIPRARQLADFLKLTLAIQDADYFHIEDRICRYIGRDG